MHATAARRSRRRRPRCRLPSRGRYLPGRRPVRLVSWLVVQADDGACPSGADGIGHGADVVGAVVPLAVNKECRCAGDAAEIGGVDVLGDLGFAGARWRSRFGSIAVSRKTSQVSADEHTAADRMPTSASASSVPWKASEAISRDTMKPMPAMVPTPATAAQPIGGRIRPRLTRVRSHAN